MSGEIPPFTVLVPDEPGGAITLIDRNHALCLAFLKCDFFARLAKEQDFAGIYVLFEPISADGT